MSAVNEDLVADFCRRLRLSFWHGYEVESFIMGNPPMPEGKPTEHDAYLRVCVADGPIFRGEQAAYLDRAKQMGGRAARMRPTCGPTLFFGLDGVKLTMTVLFYCVPRDVQQRVADMLERCQEEQADTPITVEARR